MYPHSYTIDGFFSVKSSYFPPLLHKKFSSVLKVHCIPNHTSSFPVRSFLNFNQMDVFEVLYCTLMSSIFSHRSISSPECVQNIQMKVDTNNGNKFRTILKLLFFFFTLTSKRIFTLFFLLGIFIGNFYTCHCLFLNTESRPRYSQQFSRVHLN